MPFYRDVIETSNCCRDTNFNALDNIRYFEHEKMEEEKSVRLEWAKSG